ncbi:MAG: bifunctional (p)ppGpp synthetase/guanosine-3',5'-bis(diphosphate) 3'-pyrophosphohydrolase [Pseudomonadota bacterium]
MIRQYELVDRVRAYDPEVNEALLNKAYVFAMKAHGNQVRHSGDAYFSHPLEVAGILTRLKLDSATIATALLHDTVEDTATTLDDIGDMFGETVQELVDGVTKLNRLDFTSEKVKQAENFRKLMLAMSKDVRVLLIKLADRLHNMRTIYHHPKAASRRRIAQETLEIYAPLAARMGIQDMREELEDRAFEVLDPKARASVIARLNFLQDGEGDLVGRIEQDLKGVLEDGGLTVRVKGRRKTPYSTWSKMQDKEISFEQLSDIVGFRIIVENEEDIYRALGIIHRTWPTVPGRFKDYLSTPKPNGYRSLHTAVVGPQKQRVEVQIRTQEMDDIAEYGVAAHWRYKERPASNGAASGANGHANGQIRRDFRFNDPYQFLGRVVELLDHAGSSQEFLEHTKLELFQDQVFCFTPKGDLISLPVGATPVDFAYAVHTRIGDTCVGAKVNGRVVHLRTRLRNGDSVEVLRSETQTPDPIWESFVKTGKARSAIRRYLRQARRKEYRDLGAGLLEHAFREAKVDLASTELVEVAKKLGEPTEDGLFERVGSGGIAPADVVRAARPSAPTRRRRVPRKRLVPGRNDQAMPIDGLKAGLAVHLATCCHPIPHDRIVGILEPGKGLAVHTIDCARLESLHDAPERWVDLRWRQDASEATTTVGRIRVTLAHEPGSLGALCTVIANYRGNITNFRLEERRLDMHEALVDLEVEDTKHLAHITAALRATRGIISVRRVRG